MSYDVFSGKLTNTLLRMVLPNVAFDKRWLISEAIEMQREKHQRREKARGLTVDAFHRRIINGYQRCTFDNEITNFSAGIQKQQQQRLPHHHHHFLNIFIISIPKGTRV